MTTPNEIPSDGNAQDGMLKQYYTSPRWQYEVDREKEAEKWIRSLNDKQLAALEIIDRLACIGKSTLGALVRKGAIELRPGGAIGLSEEAHRHQNCGAHAYYERLETILGEQYSSVKKAAARHSEIATWRSQAPIKEAASIARAEQSKPQDAM